MEAVRLLRDKVTGESRRFAFVEFASIEAAQQYLYYCNGSVELDGAHVEVVFGKSPGSPVLAQKPLNPNAAAKRDWLCPSCSYKNFERRDLCLRCNTEKPIDDERYVRDTAPSLAVTTDPALLHYRLPRDI